MATAVAPAATANGDAKATTAPAPLTTTATTTSPPSVVPPSWPSGSIPHLFAGAPLAAQMGPAGTVTRFPGVKGADLAAYFWPAAPVNNTPKAVVLFIHGHGSYCLHELLAVPAPGHAPIYAGSWAQALNAAGYSVCGIDARGAGFSSGVRCYAESFTDYVDDTSAFAAAVHGGRVRGGPPEAFAGLPMFVMGVSLGGCIAVHVLERGWVPPSPPPGAALSPDLARPPPRAPAPFLKGAILLAPMLSLDAVSKRGWNRVLLAVGSLISAVAPTAKVARMPRNDLHPELQALWDGDPLCWHAPTRARNGMEYLRATAALATRTPGLGFPFLAFHGAEDTLTDPAGTAAFTAAAGSADKSFRLLPGRWHVLVREPGNEALLAEAVAWCDARL
jgi:acylglycerol lipase